MRFTRQNKDLPQTLWLISRTKMVTQSKEIFSYHHLHNRNRWGFALGHIYTKRDLALLWISWTRRKGLMGKEDWRTAQLISYKIIMVLPSEAILLIFQLWNQLFMQVCFIAHLQLTESCICSIAHRVLTVGVHAKLTPIFARLMEIHKSRMKLSMLCSGSK